MSERGGDCVILSMILGALLGLALAGVWWGWATYDDEMVRKAIQRRGYDVDALASETEVDYWKARATGRVADPQPVKEEADGR